MFANGVVEVSTERETLCARIHVGSFLVEVSKREKHLCLLATAFYGDIVFLLNAGAEHNVHPIGVGQFVYATCTE